MDAASADVTSLAKALDISYQAVRKVLDGRTKSFTAQNNTKAAAWLGVNPDWLSSGTGEMQAPGGRKLTAAEDIAEYGGKARASRHVPVVGTAKMGNDGFYDEISEMTGAGDGHIEIATEDPNAYGLRVKGQSMFPAIRDNWYVLIEPNGTPREGEYVLLKLRDGRKMVKEFLYRRNGSIEAMSVNGGERITIDLADLDSMQPVGAVVSPSKWRPD